MSPQYHPSTCLPLFLGEYPESGKRAVMRWRMDVAKRYQQVLGKHGFDYVMDCEAPRVGRRAHDSPLYHVKSLPNGWCIDV